MARVLTRLRTRFLAEILASETFALRCTTIRRPSGHYVLSAAERRWALEAAFLKVVIAWEVYLEYSLACYIVGQRAPSGFRARRKMQLNTSIANAVEVLRGDKEFVGWLSPRTVLERAEKWLEMGAPFTTPITAASSALVYVRLIRNAVAHDSDAAQEAFLDRCRKLYGALPVTVSPGERLQHGCPASVPAVVGPTLFEGVIAMFRGLAARITP